MDEIERRFPPPDIFIGPHILFHIVSFYFPIFLWPRRCPTGGGFKGSGDRKGSRGGAGSGGGGGGGVARASGCPQGRDAQTGGVRGPPNLYEKVSKSSEDEVGGGLPPRIFLARDGGEHGIPLHPSHRGPPKSFIPLPSSWGPSALPECYPAHAVKLLVTPHSRASARSY